MAKRLVIDLVGRICMVTKEGQLHAVFLHVPADSQRNVLAHVPLLSVPLSMLNSVESDEKDKEKEYDAKNAMGAEFTTVTRVRPLNEAEALVDKMGIWRISGLQMTIEGDDADTRGTVDIVDAADLNAIVASVRPGTKADFQHGVLDPDPTTSGVAARLLLPKSATVTAITEDHTVKTFRPGRHIQHLASYVRCEIPFRDDLKPPLLRAQRFKDVRRGTTKDYPSGGGAGQGDKSQFVFGFVATKYEEITLTMSNLCNCIENKYAESSDDYETFVTEDPEFFVYYRLLKEPRLAEEPLPTSPPPPRGAIRIPICFEVAREQLD